MSDSELYSRLLFPQRHGYPLFHPQPFDDLPEAARRTGTLIGDVGLVTQDGSFDPIFNILCARDDPSNRFGVPPGFEQVHLGPEDIAMRAQFHLPGSDISNTAISKRRLDVEAEIENNIFLPLGAGAVVEISTNSKQTALLLLPDGASRWDLRPQQLFRDYALKHADNWYAFVNGNLQRMVGNGDLYLVTGVTKSTSWGVAAIENHSGERQISLRLKAAQISNFGATCAWEWESSGSSVDSGPRHRPGEEEWRDNQSVFLRGFKVALRSKPLKRAPKIRSIVNSKWSKIDSKSTFMPFSQPQASAAGLSMPSSQQQPSGHTENSLSQSPPSTTSSTSSSSDDEESLSSFSSYHPSALINEYLLHCAADATVAVTHDDEWASVLTELDSEVPDHDELIRRISIKFQMSVGCGGVYLHPLDADIYPSTHTLPARMSVEQPSPAPSFRAPSPSPIDAPQSLGAPHDQDRFHISAYATGPRLESLSDRQPRYGLLTEISTSNIIDQHRMAAPAVSYMPQADPAAQRQYNFTNYGKPSPHSPESPFISRFASIGSLRQDFSTSGWTDNVNDASPSQPSFPAGISGSPPLQYPVHSEDNTYRPSPPGTSTSASSTAPAVLPTPKQQQQQTAAKHVIAKSPSAIAARTSTTIALAMPAMAPKSTVSTFSGPKHGPFDFERPGWSTRGASSSLGVGSCTKRDGEPIRGTSIDGRPERGTSENMAEVGAARVHASASARSVRVVAPPPIPPEHKLELNHNGASTSTIASHSNVFGGTGSWGRSTGKRLGAGLTKLMNGLKLGKSTKSTVSVGKELQHVKFPFESPMPPPPIDIPHEQPGGSERSLEKKRPQLEWEKRERRPEPPLSPKGHSASLSTSNSTTLADTGVSVGYRSGAKGRSLDLGLGLAWAPVKVREAAVMPGSSFGRLLSGSWREQHGKEVAEVFRNALDEDGYLSFKKCVDRFDAHEIPFDGPTGVVTGVERLLRKAHHLDDDVRREMLDSFVKLILQTA